MGSKPKSPPPADTSHLDRQEEERRREKEAQERKNEAKTRSLKGKRGQLSPLLFLNASGEAPGLSGKLGG